MSDGYKMSNKTKQGVKNLNDIGPKRKVRNDAPPLCPPCNPDDKWVDAEGADRGRVINLLCTACGCVLDTRDLW